MTSMVQILSRASVACPHPVHPLREAVAALEVEVVSRAKSVPKTCSTCSSVACQRTVDRLVAGRSADPVSDDRIIHCWTDIDRHLVFTATFGPGGFQTTRTRTNRQQQQQQAAPAEPRSIWMQLLPLFILFGFSLLNALPSLFSTPTTPDPRFSFSPSARYNVERTTGNLHVKYHVNAAEFSGHPIAAELARNDNKPGSQMHKFESSVERLYTSDLYSQCQRGLDRKERRKDQEVGIFGIGTDWEKVKQIDKEPIESCDKLRAMGLLK